MFSGKTEELIRRLKRAQIANKSVKIFKPTVDNRFDAGKIVSHDARGLTSQVVGQASEILDYVNEGDVVGIDEAQFFDESVIRVSNQLASMNCRVVLACLDMDFRGNPFEPVPQLLAIAEYVTKLQAICMVCGGPASYSYRKIENAKKLMLGAKEHYEARCRKHFFE